MRFALLLVASTAFAQAIVRDLAHHSNVFGEERRFRVFLPPDYDAQPSRRYPVVYFFHGWGERYNMYTMEVRNYDRGADYGGDTIAAFVGEHDLIVVKWDGWDPRFPDENYPRPYNVGPVQTHRQFPLYFAELVRHVDSTFRTIPDREHRGVSGISMGGFMSFWIAGKFPHLVGSASNFMGSPEYHAGPREAPTEYRHREVYANYEGVRTRLVTGTRDFLRWFHRRMNAVWDYARPHYEREEYASAHGTPGMARTLAFHLDAFRNPLPRPPLWHHTDIYPEFEVWGWSVKTDRRAPGNTVLENVSRSGFRSVMREWIPGGALMPGVSVRITTAPLYEASRECTVTIDGRVSAQRADATGRLTFALDGAEHNIGIGSGPILTVAEASLDRLTILNKGAAPSAGATLRLAPLVTPDALVSLPQAISIPDLAPGGRADIPLHIAIHDNVREILALRATLGAQEEHVFIRVFREAPVLTDFVVLDGVEAPVWVQGTQQRTLRIGNGNGNGVADAGEQFAIGVKDGPALRLLELFTSDACVDNTARVTDIWHEMSALMEHYSLPRMAAGCRPAFQARWVEPRPPEHIVREARIVM